jgi:hypothetical protein
MIKPAAPPIRRDKPDADLTRKVEDLIVERRNVSEIADEGENI